MRMSELSSATGVPTATIKWYLREGLLPKGTATARNQATYDDSHVRRLRVIRALIDIGGLSTQQTREILALIDDPRVPLAHVVAMAHGALARPGHATATPAERTLVDDYFQRRGWQIDPNSPTRSELASLLATMQLLNPSGIRQPIDVDAWLDPYADAIESFAAEEVASIPDDVPREVVIEYIVLGTVLAERTIGSLRRLAQESRFRTSHASHTG